MKIIKRNLIFLLPLLALLLIIIWNYSIVRLVSSSSNTNFIYTLYGLLVIIGLASLFLVYFFILKSKFKISLGIIAACSIFVLGVLYTIYLPPLSAPDEPSHYISAYKLSNTILGKPVTNEKGYVLVRGRDLSLENLDEKLEIVKEKDKNVEYIRKRDNGNSAVLYSNVDFSLYNIIYNLGLNDRLEIYQDTLAKTSYIHVNTTPLIYVPQAIGISLARILNLDTISLLFMGRIFNLIFFAIIIGFAIHKLPFLKEAMYIISLFPMTLNLAASFSYDAMIIALVFLFLAYILNLAYKKEEVEYKDILFLAILAAIFAPCKIVYAPVIALVLIIPKKKYKSTKIYIASLIFIALIFAMAMYLVNYNILKSYVLESSASISTLANEEVPRYTIKYLFTHIRECISLYYLTILKKMDFYHLSMLGAYIGNNNFDIVTNIGVPYIFTSFISLALVISSLDYRGNQDKNLSVPIIIYNILIFLAAVFLIMLSMLVACTPMSSNVILGVQGRYFIPVLPLLILGFRNLPIKLDKNINRELIFLVYATNIYILINTFAMAISR